MPHTISIDTGESCSPTMRYIYVQGYMLVSIVAHIVAHQISPSQPIISTLFSLMANLIPIAVAWLLIWDSQKEFAQRAEDLNR